MKIRLQAGTRLASGNGRAVLEGNKTLLVHIPDDFLLTMVDKALHPAQSVEAVVIGMGLAQHFKAVIELGNKEVDFLLDIGFMIRLAFAQIAVDIDQFSHQLGFFFH